MGTLNHRMLHVCVDRARSLSFARVQRTAAVVVAALTSLAASAAEFRALDFDAACDDVAAREAAMGSQPYGGELPSGYEFAFRGRHLERDAVIAYACRDGRFYRGAYIFDVVDGDEATRLYGVLKREVTRELGAPYYDFASAEHRRKMQEVGATLSRADTQVAFWKNATFEAHASVAEPARERGWRVSLSYTALSALEE